MRTNDIREHSFESGAMSIIQMGEELIGHPTTAINELVKNGYDADATKCFVYVNVDNQKSFVTIYDNGLGMSHNILFGSWLKPSSSSKRIIGAKSLIYERSYLGSKGIGRLAAMALGKVLTVISKTCQEDTYNWLSIRSDKFRSDKLLSDIKFPGDKIKNYYHLFSEERYLKLRGVNKNNEFLNKTITDNHIGLFKQGTLIVIEDIDDSLRTIYSDDFSNDSNHITLGDTSIYQGLSVLITPLVLNSVIQDELVKEKIIDKANKIAHPKSSFEVNYGTNLLSTLDEIDYIPVSSIPVLDKFDYRVLGKVTKAGNVQGKFICQRLLGYEFTEEFNITNSEIFEKEIKKIKTSKKPNNILDHEWNADTGEFYFDIRIYDRGESDTMEKLLKLVKGNSVTQKKLIIDKLLGLRISKNGFGVKPYGEEIKDWLNLGQLRVQNPGYNVSTNQILGYVFFYSPENDGLKEKTNREGFYENKAFIEAKQFLQVVFKNIGRLRYNFRLRHNLGQSPKNKLQRPDTQSFIEFIEKEQDQISILKRSKKFIKEVTTALDNMEDTLSFSQRLASLGTGLELVYHELAQPISKIGGSRAIMNRKVGKISENNVRESFIAEISEIGVFVSELEDLKSSLKPAIGKSVPKNFKPVETFKKVCFMFKRDFEEENITILIAEDSELFEIKDYEYAFWITFLNIVNNAIYWLKLSTSKERNISFSIENESIIISNTGPKIPESQIDLIFEYGFTLKKEKSATGLGLAFSKSILNMNNWNISAENISTGPNFFISKQQTI